MDWTIKMVSCFPYMFQKYIEIFWWGQIDVLLLLFLKDKHKRKFSMKRMLTKTHISFTSRSMFSEKLTKTYKTT